LINDRYAWHSSENVPVRNTVLQLARCPSKDESEKLVTPTGGATTFYEARYASHYAAVLGAVASVCPPTSGNPAYTMLSPCGNAGGTASNGIMYVGSKTRFRDITDGTSKTFLIGELAWNFRGNREWFVGGTGLWNPNTKQVDDQWLYNGRNLLFSLSTRVWYLDETYTTRNGRQNSVSFGSLHAGGAHFGLADGSVRFVSENVSLEDVLKPYACRNDGLTPLLD
jgi:hypothetical protein